MKILFVTGGNSRSFKISPVVQSQGDSLKDAGISVDYFPVTGKGIIGYLRCTLRLRQYIKENHYDIIHAHYTLSGWAAVLAFSGKPIILSLMGTDAYGKYYDVRKRKLLKSYLTLLTYVIQPFVSGIVCKSKSIEEYVYTKHKSFVIPNGVSLDQIEYRKNGLKEELNLSSNRKYVLFLGNKESRIKNYNLVKAAFQYIDIPDVSLIAPYPVRHDTVIKYLNTVDVLVMSSLTEGSPNVVKESMACGCPVVATNVGDVEWLFGEEPGYFISDFDPVDMAEKIKQALRYSELYGKTNGRRRIIELGLDSKTIALKLVDVYKAVLRTNKYEKS